MTFEEALILLKKGHRIIRKSLKEDYDQTWLYLEDGIIYFMNEPWEPGPLHLRDDLLANDWIDVEGRED
jgi:hypothetical protein